MTAKQKTCTDRVQRACESRLDDIRSMLCLDRDDVELGDDGTLDIVIYPGSLDAIRYTDTADYRDESGTFDLEYFLDDNFEDIREQCYEQLYDYGLSFDYVAPGTFEGQTEGYIRYQISWGGPSEEIRFFVSPSHDEYSNPYYRAEFWFLDWFDGARLDVTADETVATLYDWFDSCGAVSNAIREATE